MIRYNLPGATAMIMQIDRRDMYWYIQLDCDGGVIRSPRFRGMPSAWRWIRELQNELMEAME